ncbi:MAG: hypothetical protein KKC46_22590 [Proteobacteria bacterium]|nr:hypothetical protein [Pseudomonadota bacterium]
MVCQQVSALEGLESKIGSDQISVFGYFMTGLALSNDAETDGENNIIGDPTETALYTAAKLNGFDKKELEKNFPRVAEIPFNSDRKCMTTFHKWQASSSEPEDKVAFISFTKGALDVLIEKSVDVLTSKGVTAVDIGEINKINDAMAADGMRVLCLCIRKWAALPDDLVPENVDNIRKFIKYIMTINELLFTLALSSVVFIAVEIEKFIKRKKSLNVF